MTVAATFRGVGARLPCELLGPMGTDGDPLWAMGTHEAHGILSEFAAIDIRTHLIGCGWGRFAQLAFRPRVGSPSWRPVP